MSNVLITGGAGFIGSHTADLLLEEGFNVTLLDDLSSGTPSNANGKAKLLKINLSDIAKSSKKIGQVDYVVHCAGQISVTNSIQNPLNDANINILGGIKLLEFCNTSKIKKIVSASTAAIYGTNPPLPALESFSNPQNPYAISKFAFEKYLAFNFESNGLDYASLRYSNVYGPRQNALGEAGVVTVFINSLMSKKIPLIYGDGNQTRDFIFVQDVARANVIALTSKTKMKTFNISSQSETSINTLFSKLSLLFGNKIPPRYAHPRAGDVRFSSLNNSQAKKDLGWLPKTNLDEGLKLTTDWFFARQQKKTQTKLNT